MGRNLGPLNIKDSYEGLVQISGSELTDGSGSLIPSLDVSASYATTASFALNVTPSPTGSFMVTGSATDATLTFTKGDASTFDLVVDNVANASFATTALTADDALTATSASHAVIADSALTATSASYAATATSASYATTASLAQALEGGVSLQTVLDTGNTATEDINLTGDITATTFIGDLQGNADTATSSSHAIFADTASFLPSDTNLNINSITASNASFQSASIGYLQAITGSAKIIGDAYIILNNDTPTERFAGIVVQDSGSTANTASLEFDGQTNDWFYEYTDDGGATVDHGVAMFGPEYNTKGSPVYPTNNRLLKGDGGHHLLDSSITDDGSKVTSTVPLADMVLSGSKTVISGSLDIVLPTDASDVNIINPDEKLALIVRGGIMAGSDESLSTDPGFNNHLFGERITAQSNTQTCGALGSREVDFGGNGIEYSAFIATQGATFDGGNRSAFVGGFNNTMDTEDSLGDSNVIITGQNHRIGAGERNVIAGGNDNTIVEGNNRAIIAGKNNTLGYDSGVAEYSGSVILGGSGNSSKHNSVVMLGTTNITSDAHDTVYAPNLHLTGSGATLTFNDGTTQTTAGSAGLLITGSSYYVAAATGISTTNEVAIGDDVSATGGNNVAIGADASANGFGVAVGQNATMDGSGVAIGRNASAAGFGDAIGYDSDATGSFGLAIGRGTQANGTRTTALGSGANASTTDGIAIGANTNATGSYVLNIGNKILGDANGIIVDGLNVDEGTVKQHVQSITIASNTGSLDASTGNLFEITLGNGVDTQLEIENQTAGQTFQLKITNNATAAGTISFDSQFEFEEGTAFEATAATGAVDILTLTTFDGTSVQCVGAKNFS